MMIIQAFIREVKANKAGFTEYYWKKPGDEVETVKIAYNALLPGTNAFVGSGLHVDDVDAALLREAKGMALKMGPLAVLFVVFALYIGRGLSGALRSLTHAVEGIAAGRLDTTITGVERRDEIGVIARALHVFRNALAEKQATDDEARQRRESERHRQERVAAEIATFEHTADSVVLTISSAATELEAAANELSQAAKHTTLEASTVAAAATQTTRRSMDWRRQVSSCLARRPRFLACLKNRLAPRRWRSVTFARTDSSAQALSEAAGGLALSSA